MHGLINICLKPGPYANLNLTCDFRHSVLFCFQFGMCAERILTQYRKRVVIEIIPFWNTFHRFSWASHSVQDTHNSKTLQFQNNNRGGSRISQRGHQPKMGAIFNFNLEATKSVEWKGHKNGPVQCFLGKSDFSIEIFVELSGTTCDTDLLLWICHAQYCDDYNFNPPRVIYHYDEDTLNNNSFNYTPELPCDLRRNLVCDNRVSETSAQAHGTSHEIVRDRMRIVS